jgi:hypothetical protein
VGFGDGHWVVAGDYGRIASSENGVVWVARTSQFGTLAIYDVAYDVDQWVAVGAAGKMAVSSDQGETWALVESPFGGATIYGIASAPYQWVAVGAQSKIAYSYINAVTVSGVVRDGDGNAAARMVRIYARTTGKLLGETVSDPADGAYAVLLRGDTGEVQRIVLADDDAEGVLYNDIIDRILPGPAE